MSTISKVGRMSLSCALLSALCAPLAAQGLRVNGELPRREGFAGGDTLAFQLSPDGLWAVFFADPAGDDIMELFSAPADGSAAPRKLNGPLVAGGRIVQEIVMSPPYGVVFLTYPLAVSESRVVYRADQDTDDVWELYSAPIDGSAPAVKVSGVLPADSHGVGDAFELTPDGTRVLFVDDRFAEHVLDLYSAPVDGSAPPVRLNGPLPAGASFPYSSLDVCVSPDGRTVVYYVAREIFAVPADGSASPLRLNGPLVPGGAVVFSDFQITSDGARVVYVADEASDDEFHLWSVPLDGSAPPTRLSQTLVAGGDVHGFAVTPDATRVAYLADAAVDGRMDVYSVALAGGPSTLLDSARQTPVGVFPLHISPDSARVVYRGGMETNTVYELFSVPIDGSQAAVKLNAPLVTGSQVDGSAGIQISPDGSRVVYMVRQETAEVRDLWSVPIDGSAAAVRLNPPVLARTRMNNVFRCSADSRRVVYQEYSFESVRLELWSAPIQGGSPPLRMNERLVVGGNVAWEDGDDPHRGFDLTVDGKRVVYIAAQRVNNQYALWSVPLDHHRRARELSGAMEVDPVLGDVQRFAWTGDGQRLLYTADQVIDEESMLVSAAVDPRDPGTPFPITLLGPGSTFQLSPHGSYVAFSIPLDCSPLACAALRCAPVDGSQDAWEADKGDLPREFSFDPQGKWLVFSTSSGVGSNATPYGGLFARRADGSGISISLTDPPGMVRRLSAEHPVISPDGARVVFVQGIAGARHSPPQYPRLMSVPIDRSQPPLGVSTPFYDANQLIQPTYLVTPDSRAVLYVADQEELGVFELYRAPLDASALPVRLGLPLAPFADVDPAFLLAPDGEHAFVLVDSSRDGSLELWRFPAVPARGGTPLQLSAKPVSGGGVAPGRALLCAGSYVPQPQFELSLDGKRIAYRADQDIDEVYELYSVPSDGSAAPVKLNAPLAPGLSVPAFGFRFTPDGGTVVYAAPDGAGVLRLHAVPSDASAPPLELGGPFVAGGSLWLSTSDAAAPTFELTADGTTAVYLADQRTDETIELFAVPLDASRPAQVLNGALVPGGDVRSLTPEQRPFALSPDGERVAYLADQRTDEVVELFESYLEHPRVRPATLPE